MFGKIARAVIELIFVPFDAEVPYDQTNSVNVNDLLDRSGLVRRDLTPREYLLTHHIW
jgi:hypothetical protein